MNFPSFSHPKSSRFAHLDSHCGISSLVLSVLIACNSLKAGSFVMDFNSLPSEQGWVYNASGNGATENSVFSTDGVTLTQNTLGVGLVGSGGNNYSLYDVIDPEKPFTLEMTARVLAEEANVSLANNAYGFSFGVLTDTGYHYIAIGTDRVMGTWGAVNGLDNTVFHDYRLQGQIDGTADLYIDDSYIATSGWTYYSGLGNHLGLGDTTGGVNAHAEITSYRFIQSVPDSTETGLLFFGMLPILFLGKLCSTSNELRVTH